MAPEYFKIRKKPHYYKDEEHRNNQSSLVSTRHRGIISCRKKKKTPGGWRLWLSGEASAELYLRNETMDIFRSDAVSHDRAREEGLYVEPQPSSIPGRTKSSTKSIPPRGRIHLT